MFEHVGPKNYPLFFKKCSGWLKTDGLFLLHSIHGSRPAYRANPWTDKYIFPGGVLPALEQVAKISRKYFTTEDVQNFGPDYEKTLLAWYKNFQKAYPKLDPSKYDERFKRMWDFYLLTCAAEFKARRLHLLQYVFTKKRPGTYIAAR
jgi:cyclopropane-fatty-acyl-phospholipid synthase